MFSFHLHISWLELGVKLIYFGFPKKDEPSRTEDVPFCQVDLYLFTQGLGAASFGDFAIFFVIRLEDSFGGHLGEPMVQQES
jgi:hypothetical protein